MALRRLALALLLAISALVLQPGGAAAQRNDPTIAENLEVWDREASMVEERLAQNPERAEEIDRLRGVLADQRNRAPAIIADLEARLAPFRQQLEALGPAPQEGASEDPTIARERAALRSRIDDLEALKRRVMQVDARAAALTGQLVALRRDLFTQQLLNREPSIIEEPVVPRGIAAIARTAETIARETRTRAAGSDVKASLAARIVGPALLSGLAVLLLLWLRRTVLRRLLLGLSDDMPASRKVAVAVSLTLARAIVPFIALVLVMVGLWTSGLLGEQGIAVLRGIGRTAILVIGAYALGGAFFAPGLPQIRLSGLDDKAARSAHRRLMALAAILGLDRLLVAQDTGLHLAVEGLALINLVLVTLGGIALWRLVSAVLGHKAAARPEPEPQPLSEVEEGDGSERAGDGFMPLLLNTGAMALRLAAVTGPLLAFAGYFAASRFVFYTPVFTAALIGFFVLLFTVVRELVEQLAAPVSPDVATPNRLRLIPVLVGFLLFVLAVPLVALIWGAELEDIQSAWRLVRDGFTVGEAVISPLDFAAVLLVFSIAYLLVRVAQGVLSRSVLPLTGLDEGARAAITAGVGYLGVTAAALIAVATAGLDLSNLAIVAGALSVGIGFGLQNIVNNFVSGIILLIERPIKAGDWVSLTSGMGYVKQINVRSTEIQTFDRAALIVPNSELISAPVTNYTHTNLNGRVIVPVGVGYGADPKQVEKVLLEIARAHPMMLRRPAPFVLFRGFGEYALQFEIRGILRDVNWILNVQSDLNFEIFRRFADLGIEIPIRRSELTIANAAEIGRDTADPVPDDPPRPLGLRARGGGPRLRSAPPAGMEDGDGDGGAGTR